jgi:hypothetical protein
LKIEQDDYKLQEEALSAYVWPGKVEDQILIQPIKVTATVEAAKWSLLEEISKNLSKEEIETIKNEVVEEYWFLHSTAFAEALEYANQEKKNKNIINIVLQMWKKKDSAENEKYDNTQKVTMPDQEIIRNYLIKSVQFEIQYFAEKWQWIIDKIANKELTKLDAYGEILQHQKEKVDPIAKESLDINMFLWLLFSEKY